MVSVVLLVSNYPTLVTRCLASMHMLFPRFQENR